jgi:hypothetical protein
LPGWICPIIRLDVLRDDERATDHALEALEDDIHFLARAAGDSNFVEEGDLGIREALAEVVDDVRIVGASTAKVDLVDSAWWPWWSSSIFSCASGCSCKKWICTISTPSMEVPAMRQPSL